MHNSYENESVGGLHSLDQFILLFLVNSVLLADLLVLLQDILSFHFFLNLQPVLVLLPLLLVLLQPGVLPLLWLHFFTLRIKNIMYEFDFQLLVFLFLLVR